MLLLALKKNIRLPKKQRETAIPAEYVYKASGRSDAVLKASVTVTVEIARAAKCFSEGEFLKRCMLKMYEQVCPHQMQAFNSISLTKKSLQTELRNLLTI